LLFSCKDTKIFNNGAQHWNHTFYWYCLTPNKTDPSGELKQAIEAKWGTVDKFLTDFNTQATGNFGSGWTWLARQGQDLSIVNTSNAGNPLTSGYQPLLTVDIWEHAYYIDYRNARATYLNNFSGFINWKFVEGNFKTEQVQIKL
jgi:Fe-Mn family superoxide dismutase